MYYLFLLFLFQNISLINDIAFLPNRTFLLLFGAIPDASGRTIAWPKDPAWYAAEANQKSTTRYVPFPWYRSVIKTGHKVSHWLTANLCTIKNKMNSFIFFFLLLKNVHHSCSLSFLFSTDNESTSSKEIVGQSQRTSETLSSYQSRVR